jgi:4-amino-4-deoxy-L-arabinose transferase-like glycosyltransferase
MLVVFFTALLIRSIFVLTLQDGFYFPDSVHYSRAASNLIANGELGGHYNRPPGYAVFLAAIYVLFGNSILTVRLAESVLGALLAVLTAVIGKRIGGTIVGAGAGILWSVYPLGVFIAGLVYPTGLLTFLLALGLLCFLPNSQPEVSPKRVFVAGLLWGVGALTTPVVLATVGVMAVWLIYWRSADGFKLASLLVLGAGLVLVPWTVRDYRAYGRLVVVEPRAMQHLPRLGTPDPELNDTKVQAIINNPGEFAVRFGSEFLHFWTLYPDRVKMSDPEYRDRMHSRYSRVVRETIFTSNNLIMIIGILSTGPLFLMAILGTASMWVREQRRDLCLLWGTILSFAVTYSFFYTQTRYRIPVEPYIVILSAYGLVHTGTFCWTIYRQPESRAEFIKR